MGREYVLVSKKNTKDIFLEEKARSFGIYNAREGGEPCIPF